VKVSEDTLKQICDHVLSRSQLGKLSLGC